MNQFIPSLRYLLADFMRDRFGLAMALIMPLFMIGAFTLPQMLMGANPGRVNLVLVAPEQMDPVFAKYVGILRGDAGFKIDQTDETAGLDLLKARKDDLMIVIPADPSATIRITFTDRLRNIPYGLLKSAQFEASGLTPDLRLEPHFVPLEGGMTNPMLQMLPLLLSVLVLFQCFFANAAALATAKEKGVLRHLRLAPISRPAFFAAAILLRTVVGLAQVVIVIAPLQYMGLLKLGAAEIVPLLLLSILFIASMIALGLFLAGISPRQTVVQQAGAPIIVVMMWFSGITPGLDRSALVDKTSLFLPIHYYGDAVRQTVMGQTGRFPLWIDAAVLIAMTVLIIAAIAKTFRFESAR